jgi:hypothetical protein
VLENKFPSYTGKFLEVRGDSDAQAKFDFSVDFLAHERRGAILIKLAHIIVEVTTETGEVFLHCGFDTWGHEEAMIQRTLLRNEVLDIVTVERFRTCVIYHVEKILREVKVESSTTSFLAVTFVSVKPDESFAGEKKL